MGIIFSSQKQQNCCFRVRDLFYVKELIYTLLFLEAKAQFFRRNKLCSFYKLKERVLIWFREPPVKFNASKKCVVEKYSGYFSRKKSQAVLKIYLQT